METMMLLEQRQPVTRWICRSATCILLRPVPLAASGETYLSHAGLDAQAITVSSGRMSSINVTVISKCYLHLRLRELIVTEINVPSKRIFLFLQNDKNGTMAISQWGSKTNSRLYETLIDELPVIAVLFSKGNNNKKYRTSR